MKEKINSYFNITILKKKYQLNKLVYPYTKQKAN